MNLEREVCRRVFDHHEVLKGKLSEVLIAEVQKKNLTQKDAAEILKTLKSEVETASDKMVLDYQKLFKSN